MKIELPVNGAVFTWDSSLANDQIEINQIALDVSNGKKPEKVLEGYLRRNKDMMEFECAECKMREMGGGDRKQPDLFDGPDPESGEDIEPPD